MTETKPEPVVTLGAIPPVILDVDPDGKPSDAMLHDRNRKRYVLITMGQLDKWGDNPDLKKDQTWTETKIWVDYTVNGELTAKKIPFKFKWYIVAREKHADKCGEHYHIAGEFEEPIRRCDLFLLGAQAFPWYKGNINYVTDWKSQKRLAMYLLDPDKTKEVDPKPFVYGIDPKQVQTWMDNRLKASRFKKFAKVCWDNKKWNDVVKYMIENDELGFLMQNMRHCKAMYNEARIQDTQVLLDREALHKRLLSALDPLADECVVDLMVKTILKWILNNFFRRRKHRQVQLYLWGPKGCGKTSIFLELAKYFYTCEMPYDRGYVDVYNDDLHEFIFVDEFHGQITVTEFNKWLEGSLHTFPKKGSHGVKTKNLPIAVGSNISPEAQYSGVEDGIRQAWVSRFCAVEVNSDICNEVLGVLRGADAVVVQYGEDDLPVNYEIASNGMYMKNGLVIRRR